MPAGADVYVLSAISHDWDEWRTLLSHSGLTAARVEPGLIEAVRD